MHVEGGEGVPQTGFTRIGDSNDTQDGTGEKNGEIQSEDHHPPRRSSAKTFSTSKRSPATPAFAQPTHAQHFPRVKLQGSGEFITESLTWTPSFTLTI